MSGSPKRMILNGDWHIAVDPDNIGRRDRWFSGGPGADAQPAPVPGIIQQVFPEYHGIAWYWTTFRPEVATSDDELVFVHFGAVDYQAEVWLNGDACRKPRGWRNAIQFRCDSDARW